MLLQQDDAQPLHPAAIEHSDGVSDAREDPQVRELRDVAAVCRRSRAGPVARNGSNDGKKGAHAVVGAGIVGLFAVNTVTGAWNLFGEGRQDKEGRTLRLVHGLLMMAADVGFLATTASAPE